MPKDDKIHQASWKAALELRFEQRDAGTVLADCRHQGPLRVQKALYPEGPDLCQVIVLHPPSGIVGGDELQLHVHLEAQSLVQMTTPGAGKIYGSCGPFASQTVNLRVGHNAVMEWMPQETIIFDAARARIQTHVNLSTVSTFFGWDIYCLGRSASGERFTLGQVDVGYRIERDGEPFWIERGRFMGNDPLLHSPVGLDGKSICGTLMLSYPAIDSQATEILAKCREITTDENADYAITYLPGLLMARYLGHSAEAARHWFMALWQQLRPAYLGRPALIPRIWNT